MSESMPERLTEDLARRYAAMALANIAREYPTKLDHFINGPGDVVLPSALHPVFWGSFDWHSCVHSHWMLARLLRLFPDAAFASDIRSHFSTRLTEEGIAAEIAYLRQPNRRSFVRTYGWAWLLKLSDELLLGSPASFATWSRLLHPLAAEFVSMYRSYLPAAPVPLRYGLHPNSAFGIAFAIDHARMTSDGELEALCTKRTLDWFATDLNYPAQFEPSGNEFLSPALAEADVMRRVLDADAFAGWLDRFLPGLANGEPRAILDPIEASDHHDPQTVHLDGLNLSRAWCLKAIANALPHADARRATLLASAGRHLRTGLAHVQSGDYMGEHWLATFAVYALTT